MELDEDLYHNEVLNKELDDKATKKLIQIRLGMARLGMKDQEINSMEKSNNQETNTVGFGERDAKEYPIEDQEVEQALLEQKAVVVDLTDAGDTDRAIDDPVGQETMEDNA
ncbi:hypothetical protein U1Q18_022527 [Sarracenia purpurea var. burkii]